jgi:spoIIIJ-associated protein
MADLDDLQPVDDAEDDGIDESLDDDPDEGDLNADEDDGLDDDELDEDELDDETDFATIATGSNVEDAKRNALQQLRKIMPYVVEADVEYLVVEEGSKGGFFGRGKVVTRVEARVVPTAPARAPVEGDAASAEVLREFIQTTVQLMGIKAGVDAADTGDFVRANINGEDLGLLIGRHGATIDALQYIAAIVVNGDRHTRRQVVVDAEGYRERRAAALQGLAERIAHKVARESSAVTLKPMSAAERKVVHLHLKDDPRVETVSEGQEPFRAVIVSPRRHS